MEIDLVKAYTYFQNPGIVTKVSFQLYHCSDVYYAFDYNIRLLIVIITKPIFVRGDYLNNKKEGDGIFEWTAGSHAGDRYEGKFQNDVRFVNGFSFNLIDIKY